MRLLLIPTDTVKQGLAKIATDSITARCSESNKVRKWHDNAAKRNRPIRRGD